MSTDLAVPTFERPASDEHAPYYARYVDRVPDGDLLEILQRQEEETAEFLAAIPAHLHEHRYAEGKWSIKEVVGHLSDVERVFGYRALRFARNDATPLAGFDENTYVPAASFDARDLDSLVDEWRSVRRASLAFLRSLTPEAALRRGSANGQEISVRAIAYIMAGHTIHHLQILRERYLGES